MGAFGATAGAVLALPALTAAAVPMRGWMTWEHYLCQTDCTNHPDTCISEKLIITTADAMVAEGFVDAGYNYIQIDDCYLAGRDGNGDLYVDPTRFPNGIKYIADYVHAKGMKLGLYGDVGTGTCAGGPGFSVSASPDARADAQLERDAELLMSWGMDSLKVDGCNADAGEMNVTYPKLGAALSAAAAKQGRAAPWYSCSWPDYVGDVLCNHERKEPCVPLHQIAATCNSSRLYIDIYDHWGDITNIIGFWARNPQFAALRNGLPPGTVYYNDPDQLMVGNAGLNNKGEAEVQMGMWVMFAAPLVMSTELRNGAMPKEMKDILLNREVLAVADDPLGLQAVQCERDCTMHDTLTVWSKKLADGSVAVALTNTGNPGSGAVNMSFSAAAIGLPCAGPLPPTPQPGPPPPCTFSHTQSAYLEPVPSHNIRCDGSMSLTQLKAACCGDPDCASFSYSKGNGGCLKACADRTQWVNGSADGYTKVHGCGGSGGGGSGSEAAFNTAFDNIAFEARDLFLKKDLGTFRSGFWSNVDGASMKMLRLRCSSNPTPTSPKSTP